MTISKMYGTAVKRKLCQPGHSERVSRLTVCFFLQEKFMTEDD